MASGGLIIRLVDVVLIILLGFLTISDFSLKTQIKLPSGGNASDSNEVKTIAVRIMCNNTFQIEEENREVRIVSSITPLETHLAERLKEYQKAKQQLMVVVEPYLETEIQLTVDVLDICERLEINKTISYPNIALHLD